MGQKDPSVPHGSCGRDGSAGHLVLKSPGHRETLTTARTAGDPLDTKRIQNCRNCLKDESCQAVVAKAEEVQDSISETECSERLGARKKRTVPDKEKGPPDQENPFWVPERLTRTVKSDPQHADSLEDLASVPPAILQMDDNGYDGAAMGDTLSLPEADTKTSLWTEKMDVHNLTTVTQFILIGLSDLPEVRYPLFVTFVIIYQMTLLGNGAILLATVTERKIQIPMYYLLANLSILDIFCPSATVPKMLKNLLTEDHSISFVGCALQLYFLVALVGTEVFLLAVMAYDRYVAICFPLRYSLIMTKVRCVQMLVGTWAAGFLNSFIHTMSTFSLSFCKSNRVNQYYCDIPPVVALSCSSTYVAEMLVLVVGGIFGVETSLWTEKMDVYNLTTVTQFILIGLSDLPEVRYPLFVAFVIIYQITLLGNGAILLAIVAERKLQTPMYYLLANLSLLDISCTSTTVPKMLKNLLTEDHSISFVGCALQLYFLVALAGTELFLLAVMAYDRNFFKRAKMDVYNLTTVTQFILIGLSDLPEVRYLLFVAFVIIYQMTLLGNGAILLAIVTERKLQTPMYYLLANLSLIDIFCPSTTVPKMLKNLLTEDHSISFVGCALQLYFLVALAGTEGFLLAVMAYDRYVAICFPLRYFLIMTKVRFVQLLFGTWATGFLNSFIHTMSTFSLSFCKSNRVNQYYCDIPPVVALSCSSTYMAELLILVVQEGENPNRLDPQNPVYAEETSPSVIVNGFSERLWASHIQRIRPHSENLVGSRPRSVPVQLALVQEGEHPTDWTKNPVYAEETSPNVIVNGFSERPRASHIQRIWLDHIVGRGLALASAHLFLQMLSIGSSGTGSGSLVGQGLH
ncbi:hypothetical protein U0070_011967 [Myodes glareolus]|uniref:G-protein coupled receptors family 1 profile domain-containing protein n=1 Tax=Myodes glareolus TaxID=447135 RepID=A0AAW0I3E0_MYOGA